MDPDDLPPSDVHFYQRQTLDPDARRRRELDDLKHGLRRAYPPAPVVENVDGKFILLLERLAELNLGGSRQD